MVSSLSVSPVKLLLAVFLFFAVALMFASGDAEAGTWNQMGDYPSDAYPLSLAYDSEMFAFPSLRDFTSEPFNTIPAS